MIIRERIREIREGCWSTYIRVDGLIIDNIIDKDIRHTIRKTYNTI